MKNMLALPPPHIVHFHLRTCAGVRIIQRQAHLNPITEIGLSNERFLLIDIYDRIPWGDGCHRNCASTP